MVRRHVAVLVMFAACIAALTVISFLFNYQQKVEDIYDQKHKEFNDNERVHLQIEEVEEQWKSKLNSDKKTLEENYNNQILALKADLDSSKRAQKDMEQELTKQRSSNKNTSNTNMNENAEQPSAANMYCPSALINAGGKALSPSHVWHNLEHQILNASYYGLKTFETLNTTMRDEYTNWMNQLYSFYTPARMRRTIMHPAPPQELKLLLKLASEIRHHNRMENDPQKKRKLRVLVLGGSVTFGMNCFWPDGLGMWSDHWKVPTEGCAWSFHLENLLNRVLFSEKEGNDVDNVVQVDNMAAGGQNSEVGAMALEYRLFPNPRQVPDVIISAFSANDAQEWATEQDQPKVLYEYMQSFVEAAQSLQPCSDRAPLVMMLDDFYGGIPFAALRQTGNVYMLSTWKNIMSVNYASTIKHKIMAEYETNYDPLLFSNGPNNLHAGIGMHIGIAWTILFNMVNSIVNVCNDGSIGYGDQTPQDTVDIDVNIRNSDTKRDDADMWDRDAIAVKLPLNGDAEGGGISHMRSNPRSTINHNYGEMKASKLDPKLLPNLQIDEPPFQLLGRIAMHRGSHVYVQKDLIKNVRKINEICDQTKKKNGGEHDNKCSYAWFINLLAKFGKGKLRTKTKEDLLWNDGWAAEGFPVRQPCEGWYTHTPNATFSIKVENITLDTKFIVIFSMKSYSPKWKDSKLAVSTTVVVNSTKLSVIDTNRTKSVDWGGKATHYIDGYHDTKTCVHVPHKFPIEGGAKAGDSIIVDVKLIDGQEFKIAGMALCAF